MKYFIKLFFLVQLVKLSDSKQCYDFTCLNEKCLQDAIDSNTVSTCQMNEFYGCAYTKSVRDRVVIQAKCSSSTCTPFYAAQDHETLCCSDDLCNNGTHIPDKSSAKQCYHLTCHKENCLQDAIDSNTVSTCQMNESYGCDYTKIVRDRVVIQAKCSSSTCTPFHAAPAHETLCCSDYLCNNGTHRPDKSSTTYCHSYSCRSGLDCLQKGVSDGYPRTCPMDPQYGCYVQKSKSGNSTIVIAGCSERLCRPFLIESDEHFAEYICCTDNLCNDGDKHDAIGDNKGDKNVACFVSPYFSTAVFTIFTACSVLSL